MQKLEKPKLIFHKNISRKQGNYETDDKTKNSLTLKAIRNMRKP